MKILLLHSKYQLQGGEDTVVKQELALLEQHHTVEVFYFQNQSGIKGLVQFLSSIWNLSAASMVAQKIKTFQPDVVHIHNWHFALGPLVFRKIRTLGVPIVHTVHNYRLLCPSGILLHDGILFTDSLTASFPWKAVFNKVYRNSLLLTFWLAFVIWFHKKIGTWQLINSYVCLTSFAVDLFQDSKFGVSKEQFTVKPNFTSCSQIVSLKRNEDHYLFIGRLCDEKGILILVEAFKKLPFQLHIAGDGPLKDEVLQGILESKNIKYIGNLTSKEVSEELGKAKALVFPSIWFEGMPMTILEAFAASVPIIASNLGAMTSLVADEVNGFLFEAGNVSSLQETIMKFESLSKVEKETMGTNAFQSYQSHYAPEMQLGYFEGIYNAAINKAV
ncbi:Glycosyltransferase involved in cell wall bisynthesis [Flavobacterium gillisiae]|uniref:Glycosyltransferase involved in cell wall bisynthesis n=1 Tax=Flavobacterium gillisiae TaxID=150146 RepID=A0A1H3ZQF7_9FLAO|nr:glycosyltransferase [Flavobacterium gillisiae]SEA25918.1 Glycosyltransferase involved in cell wall bisynthesis [Flavobacterium gillisiae]